MNQELLLVDFENVQPTDLARLDDNSDVIIFVGANQKNVPIELVTSAQKRGARVEWHRVEGCGCNALDFHIACHLGRVLEKSPQVRCTILSKDKGFDPLLRQLNTIGLKCRRIASLLEIEAKKPVPHDDPNYKRVIGVLGKTDKAKRPRKRKTLSQHISSMFQKNIAQTDVDRIITMLAENKMISVTNDAISYGF